MNRWGEGASNREVLTVKELSEVLGISLNTAYAAIHRMEIPYRKIGSRILIPRVLFSEWLANHEVN